MGRHDVIHANFKTRKIISANGTKVAPHKALPSARAARRGARGAGSATRKGATNAASHIGIYHVALATRTLVNYDYGRKHGLSKKRAAGVAAIGSGAALATHHATRAAGAGFGVGLATDVGGLAGSSVLMQAAAEHNKRSTAPRRGKRGAGRF